LGSLIKYSLIVFPFVFSGLPSSHSSECAFISPPMIVSLRGVLKIDSISSAVHAYM
jgi:hypothetical protein